MTKENIEQKVLPHLKIDERSKELLFKGKPLCFKDGSSPFRNLNFISQLSYGANGITYRTFHKVLKIEQLVKLYFKDEKEEDNNFVKKAITESRKNSEVNLADAIARVYDAGVINNPQLIVYSIMEFVNDSITIKDYLQYRSRFWKLLEKLRPEEKLLQESSLFGILFQESINIATYFIRDVAYLIKNNIRHGDINPGNILISGSIFTSNLIKNIEKYDKYQKGEEYLDAEDESYYKDSLIYYNNIYHINVGEINQENLAVKLIDLGASSVGKSTVEKTNQRDAWFVFSTVDKLLKPFFDELGLPNGILSIANFKKNGSGPVKKLEYSFPYEEKSVIGSNYYSMSGWEIPVKHGKVVLDIFTSEKSEDIYNTLLKNKEILINKQVLPEPFQTEFIDTDLMLTDKKRYNGQIPYQMISVEMFQLIGFVNIFYGHMFNLGKFPKVLKYGGAIFPDFLGLKQGSDTTKDSEIAKKVSRIFQNEPVRDTLREELQNIIHFTDVENGVLKKNFIVSPLFDYKFHEAGNILLNPNFDNKYWSSNLLLDIDSLYISIDEYNEKNH